MLSFLLGQSHIKRLQLLNLKYSYKIDSHSQIEEPETTVSQGLKSPD